MMDAVEGPRSQARPEGPGAAGESTALATVPIRLAIAHAADFYRRYPGEPVTFHSRVDVIEPVPGFRLQVDVESGLNPGDAICTTNGLVPRVVVGDGADHFLWDIEAPGGLEAGSRYLFTIQATVAPTEQDLELQSRATCWALAAPADQAASKEGQAGDEAEPMAASSVEETVTVAVFARGRYLKYLPALYEDDELMGRFLMLFESFWEPITSHINQMDYYFDPKFAPAELLPWLASWIGLALDERWPEDRRRLMLGSAVSLFRRRGTKRGLQDYLETFTGRVPQIVERGANNFRLGPDARLGPSVALGTSNQPHTFEVSLTLPPVAGASNEAERARLEEQRRRMIVAIIDAEKPAHTDYSLRLDVEGSSENGSAALRKT